MAMQTEWSIQRRGDACTGTGKPFEDGQYFHTLLFDEGATFRREDWSEEGLQTRLADAPRPYSQWRSKFVPPPPPAPEPIGKQTAEDLLRRYTEEGNPAHANARYILALMLERKRLLKEREVKREGGQILRIYEHTKSGDIFLIPDPQLRLDQLAEVQAEIAGLLG